MALRPGLPGFNQTHSANVLEAGNCGWAEQTTIGEGDAVVSPDGTDPIAILVADCLPVAFTTDYGATAIAHAGRVGLLAGILENTVQRLKALDADKTGTIKATIGPGICGQCYEVPADMREQAAQRHPKIYAETTWGTPALDLPAAAEAILTQTGVRVHRVDTCTRKSQRCTPTVASQVADESLVSYGNRLIRTERVRHRTKPRISQAFSSLSTSVDSVLEPSRI